jgi:hypothetical protein
MTDEARLDKVNDATKRSGQDSVATHLIERGSLP